MPANLIRINRTITPADNGKKVVFAETSADKTLTLTEVNLIVKIKSLSEAPPIDVSDPLLSEEQKDSLIWRQLLYHPKFGIQTYFRYKHESEYTPLLTFYVFRREPYYIETLLDRFTLDDADVLPANCEFAVSVVDTGSGLMSGEDKIIVWGSGGYEDAIYSPVDPFSAPTAMFVPLNSVQVLAPLNDDRKGLTIYNASNKRLYIGMRSDLTTNNCSLMLAPGRYWETPFSYKGVVTGLSDTQATGTINVTEYI